MCGIAGILNLDGAPASPSIVQRMTDALSHRGPDAQGIYCDGRVALGHRRLSIIDLSPAGQQPMVTSDRRFALSYNGEVYNFRELRAELQSLGHIFRSRSDSEVVLHAYAEWGVACVERFNGMFAFALWDAREHRLLLVRDRYGIKPLYYARVGNSLLFASEHKAILEHPAVKRSVDVEALYEYCTFQNIFTDRTLLEGIRILPAGSWLELDSNLGAPAVPRRYWDFEFAEPDQPVDETEALEELDRLFVQAIGRQLVSDVPVGSYLSGGMDSGSITAVASQNLDHLLTFTVGFDMHSASGLELQFDERRAAEFMSYRFGTEHYEMVLKAGDMARVLPKLSFHLEEPRVGQSYPNYYAAQVASKFVKVVLAGVGGDELFGGYPWRYYRAIDNKSFEDYVDTYFDYWQRLTTKDEIERLFASHASAVSNVDTRAIFRSVFGDHPSTSLSPADYVNQSLYFEAKTFLHGLLVVEDKLSMAHSLEARVPFLDNDLVDFAMRLPVDLKVGELAEAGRINENEPGPKRAMLFRQARYGKRLLRQAMERHIPQEVLEREKQGFSAPDASWFRGESIDYVRRVLFGPRVRLYDFLDRDTVRDLVGEHLDGKNNRRLLVWSLLYLENWLAEYFD